MIVQIKNRYLSKFNQIRSTHQTIFNDMKNLGWLPQHCDITELTESQVYTLYRSADGKNYATR